MCRKICHLSAGGVDDLPNNITVQNILDTLCVSCQKTPTRTTCPCCQKQLCDKCKDIHASNLQTKITGKKQDLRNMAKVMTKTTQNLDRSKIKFRTEVAGAKSEVKLFIFRTIEELKRIEAQLEAELNSLIETETERINQCQENIKKYEQEIQAVLQRSDGGDTAILENLERLSENITALLSTMTVSPATVSCKLDEQLVQDVCMGLGQIEYKPPQPGSGASTDLLQYQPGTIDSQALGTPRKNQPGSGAPTDLLQYQPIDYQAIDTPRKVFGLEGSGPDHFICPTHLDVCPVSGNLVVCDRDHNRVQVFTADGNFIRKFGSKGHGEGRFDFGDSIINGGVTVTDGAEIIIADTDNHHLQVFDEAGCFLRVIGGKGSAPGKFTYPTGVACDHSDLYICDSGNQRVQVMTLAGSAVRVITGTDVPGGDWKPVDIAVCPDGDLVVAYWGTRSQGLHVLSATGQHKAAIHCGNGQYVECRWPVGVAVDPVGHILVTDGQSFGTHRVYVLKKKSGKLVCSFGGRGRGTSPGEFNRPAGVAVTQDGTIIVVDHNNHRVQIF